MAAMLAAGLRGGGVARCDTRRFFDTVTVGVPGRAAGSRRGGRRARASTCGWSTPTGSASPATRPPPLDHVAAVWAALGVSDVDADAGRSTALPTGAAPRRRLT